MCYNCATMAPPATDKEAVEKTVGESRRIIGKYIVSSAKKVMFLAVYVLLCLFA